MHLEAIVLLLACASCRNGEEKVNGRTDTVVDQDSLRAAVAAESLAAALDQWNKAEVVKRLSEAGLVVSDSGATTRRDPLSISGSVLSISGGELDIFVYEDASARSRESVLLDTTSVPAVDTAQPQQRIIVNNNLVAILITSSGLLAERVENALLARHLQ